MEEPLLEHLRRRPGPKHHPGHQLLRPRAPDPAGLRQPSRHPPGWLLVDLFVHRSRWLEEQEGDGTASEISYTCTGKPIRASLRVADSPAVSRLYIHLKDMPDLGFTRKPFVVAAHSHAILFNLSVPLENPNIWNKFEASRFPLDYFVYSASTSPPSLHRLPTCFEGGHPHPDEDKYFEPYQRSQQRTMHEPLVGILCHGAPGEFTVADLTNFDFPEGEVCLLHHSGLTSGKTPQWKVHKVWVRMAGAWPKSASEFWIDTVIPIGDRFLCWVDYYQGMVILDVLLANKEPKSQLALQYISLPNQAMQSSRIYPHGDSEDPSRCVCATKEGAIKLVCITSDKQSRSGFTIATWTFVVDDKQGEWHNAGTIRDSGLWNLYCGHPLPRVMPCYPQVSLVDPNVICFLLKESSGIFWMIEVNMRYEVLRSSALYIHEEEEEGYSTGMARRYIFEGYPFIPSQVSTYLNKHTIKSRNISQMMQEEKQYMVMQKKSGVEEAAMQKKSGVD